MMLSGEYAEVRRNTAGLLPGRKIREEFEREIGFEPDPACRDKENGSMKKKVKFRPEMAHRLGWVNYMWGYCAYPQDFQKDHNPFAIGLVLVE